MHEQLWKGVELKLQNAHFHWDQIGRSLQPSAQTGHSVAIQALTGSMGSDWQPSFYAHFDAFLSATRSVSQVIKCGFGKDTDGRLKQRFTSLPDEEQVRRRAFQTQFDHYLSVSHRSVGAVCLPVTARKVASSSSNRGSPIAASKIVRQQCQLSPARALPSKRLSDSACRRLVRTLMPRSSRH
jgi:hypothetical protein